MRLTEKVGKDQYMLVNGEDLEITMNAYNKLGQLEDIEEEIGFEKSGSSLLAFLQTPYIESIMRLYVSARKDLERKITKEDLLWS